MKETVTQAIYKDRPGQPQLCNQLIQIWALHIALNVLCQQEKRGLVTLYDEIHTLHMSSRETKENVKQHLINDPLTMCSF